MNKQERIEFANCATIPNTPPNSAAAMDRLEALLDEHEEKLSLQEQVDLILANYVGAV